MIRMEPWNPIGDILDGLGGWFEDALRNTVAALIQGLTEAVKAVGTYFMYLPAPELQGQDGWSPAERVQAYTDWAIPMVGVIATAIALVSVARRKDADSVIDFGLGLGRVVFTAAIAIPGTYLVLKFTDGAAPWLLNNISGGTFEEGLGTMTGIDSSAASGLGVGIIVLLIPILLVAALGGIINLVFVMFSYGVLPVVVGLLPVMAAYTMTARGRASFSRVLGWLIALLLFKPVAAVIYGVGIASSRMITGGVDDAGQVMLQALYGCVLLCAGFIALPAVARIVVPAVAAGSQGGSAGGLLVGAAMVATGAATGGATAVAGAAARGGAVGVASGGATATGSAGVAGRAGAGTAGKAGTAGSGSAGKAGSAGSGSTAAGGSSAGSAGSSGAGGGTTGGGSAAGSSPVPASTSGGARGAQLRADGAQQIRTQVGQIDHAVEAGDDR